MKFEDLLQIAGDQPLFETGLLLAGDIDPEDVQRQLSRWVAAGRLNQLRRGLYTFAPPFQKVRPHPFFVANRLVGGSCVSLHSALAFYGLIPEHVPVTTSVSPGRPGRTTPSISRSFASSTWTSSISPSFAARPRPPENQSCSGLPRRSPFWRRPRPRSTWR